MTKTRDLADLGGGFIQAGTGAVQRTVESKLQDMVSVKDFGAIGNGIANDTAAIQAAIDSIGTNGGSILIPSGCILFCASSITVKKNVKLIGAFDHGLRPAPSEDYYTMGCQLKLGSGAKIIMERNASLSHLLVTRANLYTSPPANAAQALSVVGNFNGTAIEATSANDISILNCMILGHEYAIKVISSDRVTFEHLLIDCTNGVTLDTSFDINRLYAIHCWPFLTAAVSGVGNTPQDPAPNRRSGVGFFLSNYCDWTSLIDCFAYGYSKGYVGTNVSNVAFVRCQADYTNPNTGNVCGFEINGTSTYTSLVNCTAIAQQTGLIVNTTGGVAADSAIRCTSMVFAASGTCIDVQNGNIVCSVSTFNSGSYAASLGINSDASAFVSCLFDGVTSDFLFSNEDVRRTTTLLGNVYNTVAVTSPERLVNNNFVVQNSTVSIEAFDRAGIAGGIGPKFVGAQLYAAGKQESFSIRGSLASASAGNEACDVIIAANRFGSLVDRVKIGHSGSISFYGLPTSSAGLTAGDLWNDSGTIKIV
jgi:hypothetical protein